MIEITNSRNRKCDFVQPEAANMHMFDLLGALCLCIAYLCPQSRDAILNCMPPSHLKVSNTCVYICIYTYMYYFYG